MFEIVTNVVAVLAGLGGLGAFISMLVNVLKVLKIVKDGTSEQWVQGLNLLSFIAVAIVFLFNIPVDWNAVNILLGFFVSLLGFILQLVTSKGTYTVTKGLPLIGYSYSDSMPEVE